MSDLLTESWLFRGFGGQRIYVVRTPAAATVVSVRELPASFATAETDGWLSDATARLELFRLLGDVFGVDLRLLEPTGYPALHGYVRSVLERAFDAGDLVALEEIPPTAGGSARPVSVTPPAPTQPTPPSTPLGRRPPLTRPDLVDLWIRLDITPGVAAACNDRLEVTSTDGAYKQTKVVSADAIPNTVSVDLEFTDLFADKRYDLRVTSARRAPVFVFRDVPYSALGQSRTVVPPRLARADDEPLPEEVAGLDGALGPTGRTKSDRGVVA